MLRTSLDNYAEFPIDRTVVSVSLCQRLRGGNLSTRLVNTQRNGPRLKWKIYIMKTKTRSLVTHQATQADERVDRLLASRNDKNFIESWK
jgi:5-hydroxyisourate hydrolase-like protein (transthyretin family)